MAFRRAGWARGIPPKGASLATAHMNPYTPLQSHRKSSMTFAKGKPVFILDDPQGTPWVMQAYGQLVDKTLTYDGLKDLAAKLGAATVYMNPTPQAARRHWVMDENWVYSVGETVDFAGVKSTWMASMKPEDMLSALNAGPYDPTEIRRRSQYLYKKAAPSSPRARRTERSG